jgi:hypothetical protein
MLYTATKQRVGNRGVPPDSFLDQLVTWGRSATDEIFAPNPAREVYSNVFRVLGPLAGAPPSACSHVGSDARARGL